MRVRIAGTQLSLGPASEALAPGRHAALAGTLVRVLVAIVAALGVMSVFLLILGASVGDAFRGMVHGSLGDSAAIGQTLLVTVPLAFCGLAAAIPFSARVFNVGGDGQLTAGAVGATAVAFWAHGAAAPLLVVLCMLGGMVAGGAWGLIAGAMKAVASANEVIVTLMLNFVAALLAGYVIRSSWADPIAPQTRNVPDGVTLPVILSNTVANLGVLIAIAAAGVGFVLLFRTRLGFGIRATGFNPPAARLSGFEVRRVTVMVLAIAGAFAGLGGAVEVVGNHHALVNNISSSYGFSGIAVALVARLNPLGVLPVAFLFAAITVGANTLPATTGVSTASSLIVLAAFVLALLALRVIRISYPEIK
jgi:simple sugar transport system permease protein